MYISLRIKELIFEKKLSISAFEKKIGAGTAVITKILQRNSNVSGDILQKILTTYPDLDANWLITGEGSMYKSERAAPVVKSQPCTECELHKKTIENLNDTIYMYKEKLSICEKREISSRTIPQEKTS